MPSPGANPSLESVRAFYDQALKFKKAGDLDEAESICRRAVVIHERDPNILCLLGEILLRQRKPNEAQAWFTSTLNAFPDFPRALEGLGRALLDQKKPHKALQHLEKAARLVPDRYTTHLRLGQALAMTGRKAEATAAISRAEELNPDKAVISRAFQAMQEGRNSVAESILRKHLSRKPEDPAAIRLLGVIAMESNRVRAALRLLGRAVAMAPDFLLAWSDLARAQLKRDLFEEALETVDRAIALDPSMPHSWAVKGQVLSKAQRHEEALEAFRHVLSISPGNAAALSGMGHALKTIGRQEESIEAFRECIRANPAFGEAYWSLANLKTFEFDPQEVAVMSRMVAEAELADEPRVNFHYALGRHHENEGDFGQAFEHYSMGAAIRRANEVYDPVQTQVMHDRIIRVFTPEFLARPEGCGDPDPAPILIVGLPRSGSTLIEQILASHSQVEGTQELPDLSRCISEINRHGKQGVTYPEALREMGSADFRLLGQKYLAETMRYRTGLPRFTDKMPNNFPTIGLLHLMLPNAKVINACRHPLDSCLGSWKQLFYNGQSFTYDFFELGQYYLEYQRVMDHWRQVLPGKVLDVHYEAMVRDQEGQTRRLLDYLGLPFEEQCLRFWETDRAVNTASSEQVRKPIYTSALNYWRNYEQHLDELIEQLEPLLLELPPEDRPECLR